MRRPPFPKTGWPTWAQPEARIRKRWAWDRAPATRANILRALFITRHCLGLSRSGPYVQPFIGMPVILPPWGDEAGRRGVIVGLKPWGRGGQKYDLEATIRTGERTVYMFQTALRGYIPDYETLADCPAWVNYGRNVRRHESEFDTANH